MNFEEHKKQIMSKWTWYQRFSYWIKVKLYLAYWSIKIFIKELRSTK
jgi:hypothetical protein